MSDSKVPLIGRLAVHYKLITQEQLSQALADQGDHTRLGEFLVEHGLIQAKQLERLLAIQKDMLIKHRAGKAAEAASPEPEPEAEPAPARVAPPKVERPPMPRPPTKEQVSQPRPKAPPTTDALPGADDTFSPVQADARPGAKMRVAVASVPASEATRIEVPAPAVRPATKAAAPAAARSAARSETASASADVQPRPAGSQGRKEDLHALLHQAAGAKASDLHVHSGAPLRLRVSGELESQGETPLGREACQAMLADALDDAQWETLCRTGQVDFAYEVPGVGRFRANVYRQQRGLDGTFRLVPARPPALEELGLPATLARFTGFHQGMVLVTGPAGCGKSATMAALVDLVNGSREDHIITVEDPIEVIHPSKSCLVNQRQVGPHTETFARALRAALREDPDIIAIGELRDLETISLALTAAETGHFVLGTLHTNSAMRTINRLIGVFPPNQQSQIRTMVSESLRAVISQRLVRRADGKGRVPALEIMVVNKAVGNLIRENKTVQIQSILQTGAAQGMCLLDESLSKLVADGTITKEEALRHCEDPRRFGGAAA
jgi:twitching motility protein PilT